MTHEEFVAQIRATHPIAVSIDLTGTSWVEVLMALERAAEKLIAHQRDAVGSTSTSSYIIRVTDDNDTRRST